MLQTSVSKCPQEAYRGFAGLRPDLDWTCKIFSGQGCGKGTDGGAVERRLKKSNDFTLGQVAILKQGGFFNWPSPENVSRLAPPKNASTGLP